MDRWSIASTGMALETAAAAAPPPPPEYFVIILQILVTDFHFPQAEMSHSSARVIFNIFARSLGFCV